MNLHSLLPDLLGRLQARGNSLLIGYDEAKSWPDGTLAVFTRAEIITAASLAKTVICDGCEEECLMPAHTIPGNHPRAFIVCDKRDDTERVPVALERLMQWQMSGAAVVRALLRAADGYPVTELQIRERLPTLPLHKILSFDQDQLQVDTRSLMQHLLPEAETAQPNRITLTGDHWSITFQGKTETFRNTMGLRYIAWLIRHQRKEVSVADLYYAITPPDSEATDSIHSAMSTVQLGDIGLSLGDLGNAGDTLTPEGKQRLLNTVESLADQIEEAKELGDEKLQLELEERQEAILKHVAAETGLGGRTRKASSGIEKIRTSVTKRINHDIKTRITITLPELGHHLETNLHTGTRCRYSPEPAVDWVFGTE